MQTDTEQACVIPEFEMSRTAQVGETQHQLDWAEPAERQGDGRQRTGMKRKGNIPPGFVKAWNRMVKVNGCVVSGTKGMSSSSTTNVSRSAGGSKRSIATAPSLQTPHGSVRSTRTGTGPGRGRPSRS